MRAFDAALIARESSAKSRGVCGESCPLECAFCAIENSTENKTARRRDEQSHYAPELHRGGTLTLGLTTWFGLGLAHCLMFCAPDPPWLERLRPTCCSRQRTAARPSAIGALAGSTPLAAR